jgi:integrase/recombinase XerD
MTANNMLYPARRFGAVPMQAFTEDEWTRLLSAAKRQDLQDWLILSVAYEGFLRVSEVLALRSGDIMPDGRIICRRLKGSKTNALPIRNLEVRQFLDELITRHRPNKGDALFNRSRRTLDWRLKKYGVQAGVPAEKCHAHAIKHTACQAALDATGNILAVKALAGHSDIGSTLAYVSMTTESALAVREKAVRR